MHKTCLRKKTWVSFEASRVLTTFQHAQKHCIKKVPLQNNVKNPHKGGRDILTTKGLDLH